MGVQSSLRLAPAPRGEAAASSHRPLLRPGHISPTPPWSVRPSTPAPSKRRPCTPADSPARRPDATPRCRPSTTSLSAAAGLRPWSGTPSRRGTTRRGPTATPAVAGRPRTSLSRTRDPVTAAATTGVRTTPPPPVRKPSPTRQCSTGAAQDVRPELPGWAAARPPSRRPGTAGGSPMDTITRMDQPRRAGQARAKDCTNLIAKPMRMTAANLEGEGEGGTLHTRTRARHTKHTSPRGTRRRVTFPVVGRGQQLRAGRGERLRERERRAQLFILPTDRGRRLGGEACSGGRGKETSIFCWGVSGGWGGHTRVLGLGGAARAMRVWEIRACLSFTDQSCVW